MTDKIVRYDKTLASLRDGLGKLARHAAALDLTVPGVEFTIQKLTASAQQALAIARDRATREAHPYVLAQKAVAERWKPVIDAFEGLVKDLKRNAASVLQAQREQREQEREAAQLRLEQARAAEAETKGDPEKNRTAINDLRAARKALDAMPPKGAPVGVKTEAGTMFERDKWTWEVVDLANVPEAYLQRYVDPKKVDLAVKNGARDIPGLRIYNAAQMVSRVAKPGRRSR